MQIYGTLITGEFTFEKLKLSENGIVYLILRVQSGHRNFGQINESLQCDYN